MLGMTTTTLLSEDRVRELLGEDIRLFRECLDVGAEFFQEKLGGVASISSRTKASTINDGAEAHAETLFASRTGYRTRRVRGMLVVEAYEQVLVRFRRFAGDRGFAFSRNETDQTREWEAQCLDGFPELTNLAAGYRLDEFGRLVKEAHLVCSIGNRRQWDIELPARGEVIELPRTLDQDAAAAREASTETRTALRSTLREDATADDPQD
jgi:hypothetical protein